jgi:mannan polymerase II complex ANP1 subunit
MYSAALTRHSLLVGHESKTPDSNYNCHCRFQPRSQPALRRRRQLIQRALLAGSIFFIGLFFFFPDLRPNLGSGPLSYITSEDSQLETVRYYDLNNVQGTARGWEREERILLCAPLRDASPHLPMFFGHLKNLTYPHNLIDLAFLVGDSKDNTIELLSKLLNELQADPDPSKQFGEISIMEKDFGQKVNQDVESRHGFAAQAGRRKSMAQARNWLLSAALRPTHSWVYWRDVDVETAPFTILEDLMRHNKDVIVPSTTARSYIGTRQLIDSQTSGDHYPTGLAASSPTISTPGRSLKPPSHLQTHSTRMPSLWRVTQSTPPGVRIWPTFVTRMVTQTWKWRLMVSVVSVSLQRQRSSVPGYTSPHSASKSTPRRKGLARYVEHYSSCDNSNNLQMAKRMKFSVVGLPHYTIWHLYEPSVDDIRHMEEMEKERKAKEAEENAKKDRIDKIHESFDPKNSDWEKEKAQVQDLVQKAKSEEKEAQDKAKAEKAKEEKAKEEKDKQEKREKEEAAEKASNQAEQKENDEEDS